MTRREGEGAEVQVRLDGTMQDGTDAFLGISRGKKPKSPSMIWGLGAGNLREGRVRRGAVL